MKKLTQVALVFATQLLAACGGGEEPETTYTLTTGTYALSDVAAGGADACERLAAYASREAIYIGVSGSVATIDVRSATGASEPYRQAQSTIEGNSLVPIERDPFLEVVIVDIWPCYYNVVRKVSGTITGDDQISVQLNETLSLDASVAHVDVCAALPYNPTCTSEFRFTATRIAP